MTDPLETIDWTTGLPYGADRDRLLALAELAHPMHDDEPVPCPRCGTLLMTAWAADGAAVEDEGHRQHNGARCYAHLHQARALTWATCPACRVEVHTMMGHSEHDDINIHVGEVLEPVSMLKSPPTYVLAHFVVPPQHRDPTDLVALAMFGVWHRWHTPDPPVMVLVAPGTPPYSPRPEGPIL